jgi:ribulose-phosphate 3-epimerase
LIHISASLLAADYAQLGSEILRACEAGVDSFHFDMMDGHYVPNFAFTPQHLSALREYTDLPFHVHLELSEPLTVLDTFMLQEAKMLMLQWDTLPSPRQIINRIHGRGIQVGLCLNPDDRVEVITDLLPCIDLLLILGVHPGFGGQKICEGTVQKTAIARKMIDSSGLNTLLGVDGGINQENARTVIRAGADYLIMGTALFKEKNMGNVVSSIRSFQETPPFV